MSEIVIEKGIEIPQRKARRKWPFEQMEIGDSFLAPKSSRGNLHTYASHYKKAGRVFVVRTISDSEVRVWRAQ